MAFQLPAFCGSRPFRVGPESRGANSLCRDGDPSIIRVDSGHTPGNLGRSSAVSPVWYDAGLAVESVNEVGTEQRSIAAALRRVLPDDSVERVAACFLQAGQCQAVRLLAEGTHAVVKLQARSIIHAALHLGADELIIAHNHPSGNVLPSEEDMRATRHLKTICASLGIDLLDHLIVAGAKSFSMKSGRVSWTGMI